MEHVEVRVDLVYFRRGVITVHVTSPQGTTSQMLYPRLFDSLVGEQNYTNIAITSVSFWGERAKGQWTISFMDGITNFGTGNGKIC